VYITLDISLEDSGFLAWASPPYRKHDLNRMAETLKVRQMLAKRARLVDVYRDRSHLTFEK